MNERTKTQVLNELVEQADEHYLIDLMSGSRRGIGINSANGPFNAERVGKIIEGLDEEDRELLKGLTAEDIERKFAAYRRPRPEREVTRKRGPVTLSKRK